MSAGRGWDTMNLALATQDEAGTPEIFAALQGEGPSAGVPCAFVRLSRCNLACVWCDTAYTWHFEGDDRPHRSAKHYDKATNQVVLPVEEVAARIAALGQRRLVVTGGEPLLQGPALAALLALLPGIVVEVETNGTTRAAAALDPLIAQFNVSPKLSHSGNAADLALLPERLSAYAGDPRAWFKFVVARPGDVEEVVALIGEYGLPRDRIFLMPEGTTSRTLRERASWIAARCLTYGLRFSDRLHIHLHGDSRGT